MKHNCENIEIIPSEKHVIDTIYNAVETYYNRLGYYTYQKAFFIGRCVGIKKDYNWIYEMIYNPQPTVCLYMHVDIADTGAYIITVEHRSEDMLSTSKGLCKAFNQLIPGTIIWDVCFIDDTEVI